MTTPSKEDIHQAAQKLLFALAIYPGYKVESRGPTGCILDALCILDPEAAAKIMNGDHEANDLLDPTT